MKWILFSFVFSNLVLAQTFEPKLIKTNDFKIWVAQTFRSQVPETSSECKFETKFNKDLNAIEIRMGVVGSHFDYFGWDMHIPMSDFPLKKGFKKEFISNGASSMVLSYDGKTLKHEWIRKLGLWSRIYPFALEIDSNLTNPKSLKAQFAGYESNIFGQPKKHITQECFFHESLQ